MEEPKVMGDYFKHTFTVYKTAAGINGVNVTVAACLGSIQD